jgi:hypothetical protein
LAIGEVQRVVVYSINEKAPNGAFFYTAARDLQSRASIGNNKKSPRNSAGQAPNPLSRGSHPSWSSVIFWVIQDLSNRSFKTFLVTINFWVRVGATPSRNPAGQALNKGAGGIFWMIADSAPPERSLPYLNLVSINILPPQ